MGKVTEAFEACEYAVECKRSMDLIKKKERLEKYKRATGEGHPDQKGELGD
jgi:molybdopterin synthase catalytic subunit